jgi:hypothetical protein
LSSVIFTSQPVDLTFLTIRFMKKQTTFAANRPSLTTSTNHSNFLTPDDISLTIPSQVLAITHLNPLCKKTTSHSTPTLSTWFAKKLNFDHSHSAMTLAKTNAPFSGEWQERKLFFP